MERREVMGPRPSEIASAAAERMRSRLTRTKAPLSVVSERTETDVPPRKSSPPVPSKRASLQARLTRRPSTPSQPRPALSNMNTTQNRPRTRPPVPSRERKPAIQPRRNSLSRDNHYFNVDSSEVSSIISTNTEATSAVESDATPPPPVERERQIVRRPTVRKSAAQARPIRTVAITQPSAPSRRTIHIEVQPQQKTLPQPSENNAVVEYKAEIKRLRQEVSDLREYQTNSERGLEDALDRVSLVTLEREEVRRSGNREKQALESLKKEVEQRCKTIVNLKARLEDRERTIDDYVARFDTTASELDASKSRAEAAEKNLGEVKAILSNREETIVKLENERDSTLKEKDDIIKINEGLLDRIHSLDQEKSTLAQEKEEAEKKIDGFVTEKEYWDMEKEKLTLEASSLRDNKLELETKVQELNREIDERLSVRSEHEGMLIERIAALEIIKESLDGQLEKLTTQVAEGTIEIEGLKTAKTGLEEQLEKECAKGKTLEEEKAGLEENVKNLEEAKTGLEGTKAELEGAKEGLEKDKTELEEAKTTLETRVNELEGSITELQGKIDGLEGEKKSQEEQITALITERDALRRTTTDKDALLSELREGGAATQADLEKLRESEEAAKSELEKLQASEGTLKADFEKLQEEHTALQGELTVAREAPKSDVDPAPAPAPADTAALEGLQKENEELKTKNGELEGQVTKITSDLEEQTTKATEAASKLEEETKKLEEETRKIQEESAKLEEKSKTLEEESAKVTADAGKFEEQTKMVEDLTKEKDDLTAQLTTATTQVTDLGAAHQAELASLRAQIHRLSRVTNRSKSPKKKGKNDELVIVRNPSDRSQLQVMRKSDLKSMACPPSTQSSDNDD